MKNVDSGKKYELDGKEIVFRNADINDAGMLIDYLKTVTGEKSKIHNCRINTDIL